VPGVTGRVEIVQAPPPAPARPRGPQPMPGVRSVLAVASGKGGVGKSTVATNLALALATLRPAIGLMDADVYGPSVPLMLGIDKKARTREDRRIVPVEKHGLRVISMGMFVGGATPVIWRGPVITQLFPGLLRHGEWGGGGMRALALPPRAGAG